MAYGLSRSSSWRRSPTARTPYFLPLGLALSAVCNLVVAFVPAVSASLALLAIVMFINGWVQGMGWPPCGRVLVHWFSTNERGWKTAIWNTAHNVGGMAIGAIAAWALAITNKQWQAAFWLPGDLRPGRGAVAFLRHP